MKILSEDSRGQVPRHPKKEKPKGDRTVRKENRRKEEDQDEWEEIFFYYFHEMLKRFLKNKKDKTIKRGRYMSENLA